jgi:hypothetical protein
MYAFLHDILADKKGGEIFTLFHFWHFFYIAATFLTIAVLLTLMKKKVVGDQTPRVLICIAFSLYMADFFLMPLAYGCIDIEKLPFHGCTAMCVLCYMSYHVGFLQKYRPSFALLGLITNITYLLYPAGVMWYEVHPLSYRVIQTLLFHSVMTVYGVITLMTQRQRFDKKTIRTDLAVIVGMTLWALLGNYVYTGSSEGYDHFFNWFFVVRDPFSAIPENISRFIMPPLNVFLFSVVSVLLRWVSRSRENVYT